MPNRLSTENSPYLLQHAGNPVDWYPWSPEALEKARAENKPIFLSIGYAACHWCHVMAHESFEDPDVAAILNREFVSIKVDREQRPDLDSIYMQATTALTGSGGWPMSVFLTPDLRPFYAGTYFPPVRRYGMPAFKEVLQGVARAWHDDPKNIRDSADKITDSLVLAAKLPSAGQLTEDGLDVATEALLKSYDWEHGGWGTAPKFPQPMNIEYLLRRSTAQGNPDEPLKAALHALRAMARGGMYDVIGGGFSRYSTDATWHVPHFEKMLYDNAQLARAYLHAWQITRDPFFRSVVVETLDFVERELMAPQGAFFSSLDADSEGQEGKFYVWTKEGIRSVLTDRRQFDVFAAAYGVTDQGNWEGRIVLQRALDDASLASRFGLGLSEVTDLLGECHRRMLQVRVSRIRPATDDKTVTSWNGLMVRAFAEAATYLDDSSRKHHYGKTATRSAAFLLNDLRPDGRLRHTWRNGRPGPEVFLEDFASLILALLQVYQVDFDAHWFASARALTDEMLERFSNPAGGFFDTPSDAQAVLIRGQDLQDNATPSGNAMSVEALLVMAALDGSPRYHTAADTALRLVANLAPEYPSAFAQWLSAADRGLKAGSQVAILYPQQGSAAALLDTVRSRYIPNLVVAACEFPPGSDSPPLLRDRSLRDHLPTAFACRDFVCEVPVTSPEALAKLL